MPGSFLNKKAMVIPVILVVIFILAFIGYSMHGFMRFERNLVARLQFSSVADKMAQSAAFEAANWFGYKTLNINALDPDDPKDKFILAPVRQTSVNGLIVSLDASQLKSFNAISELGGSLDSVELKYESFLKYFNDSKVPSDYSKGFFLPADPFERFGGLLITAKVKYKTITRVFYCRHDLKIANTLTPVLSKFTFFVNGRDGASENQIVMGGLSGGVDVGSQGIINTGVSPLRVPLILIHHPADVSKITGYAKNHSELDPYLPLDATVTTANSTMPPQPSGVAGQNSSIAGAPGSNALRVINPGSNSLAYRPSMTNRGWVYLGVESPEEYYHINLSPGKVNPDTAAPYPASMSHRYYGAGFLTLESDLCALVFGALKGSFPYANSFADAEKPGGIKDYIIRVTHLGIYWLFKHPSAEPIVGNFYALNPSYSDNSSLLHLCGDMQAFETPAAGKPSKYLNRRSPTIVFGKVARSYGQIVSLNQNCVHPPASPDYSHMQPNGMHKMPMSGPNHPKVAFIPFFNIDDNGNMGPNPKLPFNDPLWGDCRLINDNVSGNVDYAKTSYDINNNIFKCADADHYKTYKFFMTKIIFEVYNKSYNWIVGNSTPAGGIMEPGSKYTLKQDEIKILSSYPDAQPDSLFFYNEGNIFGNCIYGSKLKISQYKKAGGEYVICNDVFFDSIFKGALQALRLVSEKYKNPLEVEGAAELDEYDIRHKANYIFDSYSAFEKSFIDSPFSGAAEVKEGGIFYIDSDQTVDITKNGTVGQLVFHENTMIIVKKDVKIPSIVKSPVAKANHATLTIISSEGDVVIAGKFIEASVNSFEGSVKKSVDYFQVFGNMSMKKIYFNLSEPGNLFKVSSIPSGDISPVLSAASTVNGYERISVTYDPDLDCCDAANYINHYKYALSAKQTYWKVSNE